MTNYIILQKVYSKNGNQMIIKLESYFDLPTAKKDYDKLKNKKKGIPYILPKQKLLTQLIVYDLGNSNLKNDKKEIVLEQNIISWGDEKDDEVQKQES